MSKQNYIFKSNWIAQEKKEGKNYSKINKFALFDAQVLSLDHFLINRPGVVGLFYNFFCYYLTD